MKLLPSKADIVPGLILAFAAIMIAGRVGFVRQIVYGSKPA